MSTAYRHPVPRVRRLWSERRLDPTPDPRYPTLRSLGVVSTLFLIEVREYIFRRVDFT